MGSRGHSNFGGNRLRDSDAQIDAKRRLAARRRCPACQRKCALSKDASTEIDEVTRYHERTCRYCGQVVAFTLTATVAGIVIERHDKPALPAKKESRRESEEGT